MKQVLVLGAGLVARPYVQYMLDHGYKVTVASRTVSKAMRLLGDHPNGEARAFDISRQVKELKDLVKPADLVVSLLPFTFHVQVARECLRYKVNMLTTSYVSDEMRALDGQAKSADVILMNECGVDPGQDHMSAMKIIHKAQAEGGKVLSFTSFTGGLPAPDANTNPFEYKLSWSPRGVLLAGRNSALFLRDGKEITIPGEELFANCHVESVPELGDFEGYPNRDSLQYIDIYGLKGIQTMLRGTLRYPGWCKTMYNIGRLGLLELDEQPLSNLTYADFVRRNLNFSSGGDLKQQVANYLKLPVDDAVIEKLDWLGLFNDQPIAIERGAPIDVMVALFEEKLQYSVGERDMIVMQHQFIIEHKDNTQEQVRSTLIDYGIPNGDSSMSRTVALPAAIASHLILTGEVQLKGVQIPIVPELYEPILQELETMNIRFKEESTKT
ncbi:MAG: saccharopine dehydrogenase C-terminal domain-containing protein [Candidatus Hermodarchaeota archaeon]|nr:saccharopine dehydrogenase C-terminal domain-containing protein [Candidatus Hermodarchaeota archaeon]